MHEYEIISEKMYKYHEEGNYDEWNKLVPKWRKAFLSHNFGFKKGQEVEYWNGRWKRGTIREIRSNLEIVFDDIINPATLVRRPREEYEQLSFFDII